MIKLLSDFSIIIFFLIPWCLGCAVILAVICELYTSWLWSGMDEEKRYDWIKISRW